MAASVVPAPADVKELRIALVCYGGVSLAVYMHGITKEIHKLVIASNAFEFDREHNPFPPRSTERIYWDILKSRLASDDDQVATRVVLDIVAGTSAGGINGVCLAKAVAHNRSQDDLRDLWIHEGDIAKLLRGPRWLPIRLRGAVAALRFRPVLRGELMSSLLFKALENMDRRPRPLEGRDSLLPDRHPLHLFVTMTDFHGYPKELRIDSPAIANDRTHRHVMEFRYSSSGPDQFDGAHNFPLAFSARATASFPGAFDPVNLESFARSLDVRTDLAPLAHRFFRPYELSDWDASKVFFVDGGVLDNFPFHHAIRAIREQPAGAEVDRKLLYIEPDPANRMRHQVMDEPSWPATIWRSLSAIPAHEPILDDLLAIRTLNERVRQLQDVIRTSFPAIKETLEPLVEEADALKEAPTPERLDAWSKAVNGEVIKRAGIGYTTYSRLKISSVVAQLSRIICDICNYPTQSNHAFFVRAAVRQWATIKGLLDEKPHPSAEQIYFLKTFDLAYGRRRLRFLIDGISWLYRDSNGRGRPNREELNVAKAKLYAFIDELANAGSQDSLEGIGDGVRELFSEERIQDIVSATEADLDSFVNANRNELDRLETSARDLLGEHLRGFQGAVYEELSVLTEGWAAKVRRDLFVRLLGFPFWDLLMYPLQAMSDVGERDRVEIVRMSPDAATRLSSEGEDKLKGVAFHHFGAFFKRDARENDYLWGRLDGAERLIDLLLNDSARQDGGSSYKRAFEAILADEAKSLKEVGGLIRALSTKVAALPAQRDASPALPAQAQKSMKNAGKK